MRVALGPLDVAGVVTRLAPRLEERGVDVDVVLSGAPFGFPSSDVAGRVARSAFGLTACFRRDVLHLHGGASWIPRNLDLALARLFGRTVVASYLGDDCRISEIAEVSFPARGRVTDRSRDPDVRSRLRRMGRLAHAAVTADLELATYLRPYFARVYLIPVPVPDPPREPRSRRPSSAPPVVVHVPSDPFLKGTATIEAAVASVARELPLDFRLLSRITHEQVVDELAEADVLIDQLNTVTTGILALEAMQVGLPVLGEVDRRALAPYQQTSPIVPVTPDSVASELAALLRDPKRRDELGARGRAFVSRFHTSSAVAASTVEAYRHARTSPPGLYEVSTGVVRPLPWRQAAA